MNESDWKKFQAMVPALRERYLAVRNARIAGMLADPAKSETERFWEAMETMEVEASVLRKCLDGHSRSKMWLYMSAMIRAGMLTIDDVSAFSTELQKELSHVFEEQKGQKEI